MTAALLVVSVTLPAFPASVTEDSTTARTLDTLTVRDQRPEGPDPTTQRTTVDGDYIRASSRATPLEALSQSSAGIYVTSRGAGLHGVASGSSGGIYMRGLGGSPNTQILIVEDGAPDYQGIFGHPIPDAFSPSLIDRVVVVKGGDGVLYGTNAMGGVILMENRWPDSAGIRFENDAAWGSYNTFRDRAVVFAQRGAVGAVGAFSAFTTEGHRDGCESSSVAGQAGVRVQTRSGCEVSVREKVVHLEGADPGTDNVPAVPRRWFEVTRNMLSARLSCERGPLQMEAAPWFTLGVHRLYDGFHSRDYSLGGDAHVTLPLLSNHLGVVAGVAVDRVDGMVEQLVDTTNAGGDTLWVLARQELSATTGGALYGQFTFKPGLGIAAVAGGRVYYSTEYGWVPLYKAGLAWRWFPWLGLQTRFSRNFRQPTLRELYLPFPTANPDLEPERAYTWDASLELTPWFGRLSCAVYRTWADELIKYFGHWPSAEVVNIDNMEITGVEVEVSTPERFPVRLELTGCWQDVGRYTRQNPEAKVNGRLEWGPRVRGTAVTVALEGEWVHGIYMENYSRERIPDVFVVDGSVRMSRTTRSGALLEPYVIVRNLLNRPYAYILDYSMPGIHLLAGIRLGV